MLSQSFTSASVGFTVREMLRATKWLALPSVASALAMMPVGRVTRPISFLLGCGRSGTTVMGRALGRHPRVCYLNEPLHYWYAIDPRTDHLNFFGGHGKCFFDAKDVTPGARKRFERLFGQVQWYANGRMVVEKLPANPLRMPWLNALCPTARFIHLIRDGRYVCRSIEELSHSNRYRVWGKSGLNQWWGMQFHKWNAFVQDCKERDILTESFAALPEPTPEHFPAMAALEWLARVRTARESVETLGLGPDRYLEIRYENLVADPQATLMQVESLLGLPHSEAMMAAARRVLVARQWRTPDVPLPAPLYFEFTRELERLGYPTDGVRLLDTVQSTAS